MSTAATGESEATRRKKKKPKHVEVGMAQSQSPHASEPLPTAPFLQTPAQSPAPGTPIPQEMAAAAAMRKERKICKEKKAASLLLPPQYNLKEGEAEARMASMKKKQRRKERKHAEIMPSSAAKTPILQQEEKVTKKRKRRMEQEPSGNSPLPLHPGDACNSFLQSPAPEILTLAEAAAMMRKRNMHKEQNLPFAPNPTLEEQGEKEKKERKRVEQILLSPSTSVAAETPIQEQEVNVIKKQKRRRGQEPSGKSQEPLDSSPLLLHPGHVSEPLLAASLLQSPAPEILTLEEATVMMRKRKIHKEQKVDALPFAQNPTLEEHGEDAMMAKKKKKRKCVEQIFSSPSTSVATETPIQEQEMKVTRKQKQRMGLEASSNMPLPLHHSHVSEHPLAVPFLQAAAPEILTLKQAAAMMRKRNMHKEEKVDALPFAQNPTLEEQREEAMMVTKKKKHKRVEQILSPPSTSVAVETTIQEQEVKKQKLRRRQEPSGNSPLPLHPGDACNSFLQSPAPEILTLEEATVMMRKRKIHKEQKVDALPFAQNPTLEEHGEDAMMAKKKKKRKCVEQIFSSPSTSVATETPIQEQEMKVTRKQKQRMGLEASSNMPLPLHHSHVSEHPLAVPFLQAAAPEILTLKQAAAMMRKRNMHKEEKVDALPFAQNPTLEEQREEAMMVTKKKKHKRVEQILPLHPGHAFNPLFAAPFLQSPAPEILTLGEAAVAVTMSKRKMRKEKVAALSFAQNPTLEEEQREEAMTATTKKKERKRVEQILLSPSTSVAAETPIQEQEVNVIKKQKRRRGQEPSGKSQEPLDSSPLLLHPGHVSEPLLAASLLQSPAPEILTLAEAAAMMRKRNMRKEQKVDPTLEEERGEKKECNHVEQTLLSPSTSAAAETPIQGQEMKVIKKQKQRRGQESSGKSQEPSGNLPLPLHPSHACNPPLAAPLLQSPAPEILTLEEAAAMMRRRKMPKEQKVDALHFAPNPTLKEHGEEAMIATTKKKKGKCIQQILSSPSTSIAAETPIQEQEMKVTRKQKQRMGLEASSNMPLPLHHSHVSEHPLAVPFLQAAAPEILTLKQAAAMMRKRNMHKEEKVDALPFAQNPTLEEQREEAMMVTKKKKHKRVEQILSPPSTSVAVETTIQEQEVKKQKQRRRQEPSGKSDLPSGNSPLPLHPGHASKPLLAAPFLQSPAPKILTLGEAAVAVTMGKRKMRKEQKVDALSFAQNPTLAEEQGEEAMTMMTKKERKRVEQILSSPTSVAAETPIQEQEVKVTKKQKQRRGHEPSAKSTLPLDRGQSRCVQSHGAKAPPKQDGENDGCKGIKKSNGKKPRVRVLNNRELIQEARKQPQPLPEGFVPFSNFVASCTEQNADHSSPCSAFFDQFRYNPVCEDRKPPLPRTPDRLTRLPPRGYSSFESSQLAANEVSRPDTTLASKTKQQDSGSGSQEKVSVEVKENPENKTREKKQRRLSGKSRLPFDSSRTCCVQLQGTKALPEQDQETDAPKVNNIEKSNSKKAHVCAPSKCELFKEMTKEQTLTEGFLAPKDLVSNCTEQSPNYSSPFGASFDPFCYRSARQDLNPQPSRSTDHLPFELSELTTSETSNAFKANNSVQSKSKKKDSGSSSTSGSQKKRNVKEKTTPEKKTRIRKPRPVFTTAEKRSDKYRRVPLDQLVPPPRSPHNLLQEKYASDPWKVMLICMFLNLTQGIQVKRMLEGFFERYPDPWSAINADPDKMAEYLSPLGLQHVKTRNIKKLSKQYVGNEWTHITQLCGVGKYAADAYAIFCAGRAREVVPDDHKLVDYWNYVCFELPMTQSVAIGSSPDQILARRGCPRPSSRSPLLCHRLPVPTRCRWISPVPVHVQ
ncbi:microtubule-associated protein futsch [Triticum aestivum]|uniref:microtubule-associated protein futsch n=1 Tax=Triticum aestivum TaxID=4565 RepID=UPI001D023366|nr:microtubule-associated protein futsch-like [Triticum aestivum]